MRFLATLFLLAIGFFLVINTAEAKKMDNLSLKEKSIVKISSYTAAGNLSELEKALNEGLDNGLSINEIKEILIQMYAYCGFPRSLNGIGTFIKVTQSRHGDVTGDEPESVPSDILIGLTS